MPAIMACPHPDCNHPGPMGFVDYGPWGMKFYHSSGNCPGMILYNDQWYKTEAEAWQQYKRDRGPFDPDWTAAFDARIIEKNERKYNKYIKKWSNKH